MSEVRIPAKKYEAESNWTNGRDSEHAPGAFVRKSQEILKNSLQVLKDTSPPAALIAIGAVIVAGAGAGAVSPVLAPTVFLLGGMVSGVGAGLAYLNSEKYFYR